MNTRGFACVATFFGAGAIATIVGDWNASDAGTWAVSQAKPPVRAELSPADAVAFRFPFDWNEAVPAVATAAAAPAAETAALTKAAHSGVAAQQALLNPRPTTYQLASAGTGSSYQLASATVGQLPAMAYAPENTPAVTEPAPAAAQAPAKPAPETKSAAAPAKLAAAAAAPAPKRDTRQVLNDAQISSIRKRLALTPDQERYWPAVEHALRQMAWKKTPGEKAKVDMSTVDVDGLKSAAFPLVMSFSDDQKRELRSLANLMGLESVASRF